MCSSEYMPIKEAGSNPPDTPTRSPSNPSHRGDGAHQVALRLRALLEKLRAHSTDRRPACSGTLPIQRATVAGHGCDHSDADAFLTLMPWEDGSSDARKRPNQGSELFLSKLLQTCTGTNAGNRLNLVLRRVGNIRDIRDESR